MEGPKLEIVLNRGLRVPQNENKPSFLTTIHKYSSEQIMTYFIWILAQPSISS